MKKYLAIILLFALLFTSCVSGGDLETTADGTIITTPDWNPDETPATPVESTPEETPSTSPESTPEETSITSPDSSFGGTPTIPTESMPEETPRIVMCDLLEFIEVGKYYSEIAEMSPEEYDFSDYEEYIEVRNVNEKNYFYVKKAGYLDIRIEIYDTSIDGRVYDYISISAHIDIVEEGHNPPPTPRPGVDPFESSENETFGKIESTPTVSDASDES